MVRESANVRNLAGTSNPSTAQSPPLEGSLGEAELVVFDASSGVRFRFLLLRVQYILLMHMVNTELYFATRVLDLVILVSRQRNLAETWASSTTQLAHSNLTVPCAFNWHKSLGVYCAPV